MDKNDALKEVDIVCYYFDDIIKIEDLDLDNILIDKKQTKIFQFCNILYKSLIDSKTSHIRINKIDGFIRVYDETRYLVLSGSGKYDSILQQD